MFSAACVSLRCQQFNPIGNARCLAQNAVSSKGRKNSSLSFRDRQLYLKQQARHSVLIQYPPGVPQDVAIGRCKRHGPIKAHFHSGSGHRRFAIVEFSSLDSLTRLLKSTRQFQNNTSIPVTSRYLFLRTRAGMTREKEEDDWVEPSISDLDPSPQGVISREAMSNAKSLSDQITLVYEKLRLTEVGERLRHLVCSHIEEALHGILPYSSVHPFGSSANGFGRFDCDLDMALDIGRGSDVQKPAVIDGEAQFGVLCHVTKNRAEDERRFHQFLMKALAGLLKYVMPTYMDVIPITQARVPIIKFQQGLLGLHCDLCANTSGTTMTEILYNLSQLDSRVRPLVFAVRHWALTNQVTHAVPGPWISNFTLTMLVIHLLQTRRILPSLEKLQTNEQGDLFMDFMDYYAGFDFEAKAISVEKGRTLSKLTEACMHIENPVEEDHNISKNVQRNQLSEFQDCCRKSLGKLNSKDFDKHTFWAGKLDNMVLPGGHVDMREVFKSDVDDYETEEL